MKRLLSIGAAMLLLTAGFIGGYVFTRQPLSPKFPQSPQSVVAIPREGTYRVTRVIDGDTIELASSERIRYHGINAPESGARWSTQAYEMNRDLVEGKSVRLELDRVSRDPYGRILAYVWIGDTMVNEALIREGFARYYAVKGEAVLKYRDRLQAAEAEAKQGHRGLWMDEWEADLTNP